MLRRVHGTLPPSVISCDAGKTARRLHSSLLIWPDDDSKIVAWLLLFLPTRQYPVACQDNRLDLKNEHYSAYRKQLAFVIGCNYNDDDMPRTELCFEAGVHGRAEIYVAPELKKLSRLPCRLPY